LDVNFLLHGCRKLIFEGFVYVCLFHYVL
jgi:hypothetical protein